MARYPEHKFTDTNQQEYEQQYAGWMEACERLDDRRAERTAIAINIGLMVGGAYLTYVLLHYLFPALS